LKKLTLHERKFPRNIRVNIATVSAVSSQFPWAFSYFRRELASQGHFPDNSCQSLPSFAILPFIFPSCFPANSTAAYITLRFVKQTIKICKKKWTKMRGGVHARANPFFALCPFAGGVLVVVARFWRKMFNCRGVES